MVSTTFIIVAIVLGTIAMTLFFYFAAPTFKMGLAKIFCASLAQGLTRTTPSFSSFICQIITGGV